MDIDEFVNRTPPGRKRSRLFPFREQIVALKSQGYTDLQIRDWLALNQIDVSREMVRKFLAKQTKQNTGETEKQANESVANSNLRKDDEVPKPAKPPLNQAEKMRAMLEEQKRDAESKHFKHDKTGNI
jgi:hypothetical protein